MSKVTVGRIVIFRAPDHSNLIKPEHPAIVTDVHDSEHCDLTVFVGGDTLGVSGVMPDHRPEALRAAAPLGNTWHWPPRESEPAPAPELVPVSPPETVPASAPDTEPVSVPQN